VLHVTIATCVFWAALAAPTFNFDENLAQTVSDLIAAPAFGDETFAAEEFNAGATEGTSGLDDDSFAEDSWFDTYASIEDVVTPTELEPKITTEEQCVRKVSEVPDKDGKQGLAMKCCLAAVRCRTKLKRQTAALLENAEGQEAQEFMEILFTRASAEEFQEESADESQDESNKQELHHEDKEPEQGEQGEQGEQEEHESWEAVEEREWEGAASTSTRRLLAESLGPMAKEIAGKGHTQSVETVVNNLLHQAQAELTAAQKENGVKSKSLLGHPPLLQAEKNSKVTKKSTDGQKQKEVNIKKAQEPVQKQENKDKTKAWQADADYRQKHEDDIKAELNAKFHHELGGKEAQYAAMLRNKMRAASHHTQEGEERSKANFRLKEKESHRKTNEANLKLKTANDKKFESTNKERTHKDSKTHEKLTKKVNLANQVKAKNVMGEATEKTDTKEAADKKMRAEKNKKMHAVNAKELQSKKEILQQKEQVAAHTKKIMLDIQSTSNDAVSMCVAEELPECHQI